MEQFEQGGQFGLNHILALKDLITGEEEEEEMMVNNPHKGSALNPGDIGGGDGSTKELAKPFAKMAVKQGSKPDPNQPQPQQKPQGQKKQKDPKDIWHEDEVSQLPVTKNETRIRPEIDSLFKQRVGVNDVYLGMSGMDPTSINCQDILLKIYLPGAIYKEVQLDVTNDALVLQTTKYYLHHVFPYPVNEKEGKAQWISDKEILQLTLPIIREKLW